MSLVSADILRLAMLRAAPPPAVANHWQVARLTGEGVAMTPQVVNSNELDPSGQVRDSILTGATTAGPINYEVSRNKWLDEMLEAALAGTWGGGTWMGAANADVDRLVPTQTLHLYTVEKRFKLPDDSFSYHRFVDSAVTQLTISITPGQPITGAVTISGGPMDLDTAEEVGAVYDDAGANPIMTAPLVTEITVDTGTVSTRCFGTLTITINNNTRGVQCIGTLGEREKVLGRLSATIAGNMYYVSDEMLQHLLDQDTFPVTVTITDSLGNDYEFDFPSCKVTAAPVVAGGTGQDVVVALAMQAIVDPTAGQSISVVREGTT